MKIEKDKVVSIDYKVTDKEKNLIDSSEGELLSFLFGSGQIIVGLENALAGKAKGDELSVVIEPAEAYGDRDDSREQTIDRSHVSGIQDLKVGMQLESEDPEGNQFVVVVKEINDDQVTLDANHPLAGEQLHFDVKVMDVREATSEELQHGHAHGEGGHHH